MYMQEEEYLQTLTLMLMKDKNILQANNTKLYMEKEVHDPKHGET